MNITFSQTHLYKLHILTNALDRLFDEVLVQHAGCTLSQLTLLLAVHEKGQVNQREIAAFLEITPAAVSRQVELALRRHYLCIKQVPSNRRTQILVLTPKGKAVIQKAICALEEHAFSIFEHQDAASNLAGHLNMLSNATKEALHALKQQ